MTRNVTAIDPAKVPYRPAPSLEEMAASLEASKETQEKMRALERAMGLPEGSVVWDIASAALMIPWTADVEYILRGIGMEMGEEAEEDNGDV